MLLWTGQILPPPEGIRPASFRITPIGLFTKTMRTIQEVEWSQIRFVLQSYRLVECSWRMSIDTYSENQQQRVAGSAGIPSYSRW
jgi:hypothetical protein